VWEWGFIVNSILHTFATLDSFVLAIVAVPFLLVTAYFALSMWLARESILRDIRDVCMVLAAAYLLVGGIWMAAHVQDHSTQSLAMLVGGVIFILGGIKYLEKRPRPRKRPIPAKHRQAVIKRDLGNIRFDGSKHHVDHVVPFSKGGSHTKDNLRVIEKKRNLQKGARHPTLWEMLCQIYRCHFASK
jgi:predicted membrane channel-forming protein YqfA (hemolysin III family)